MRRFVGPPIPTSTTVIRLRKPYWYSKEDLNYLSLSLPKSGGRVVRWCWVNKLPVLGRPTNLDCSRARACCACSSCGWELFGHFSLVYHFSFLSPSFWETARYRLKYSLKGPLSPKQPTNKPITTKKQTTKFSCARIKKNVKFKLSHIENSKTRGQPV